MVGGDSRLTRPQRACRGVIGLGSQDTGDVDSRAGTGESRRRTPRGSTMRPRARGDGQVRNPSQLAVIEAREQHPGRRPRAGNRIQDCLGQSPRTPGKRLDLDVDKPVQVGGQGQRIHQCRNPERLPAPNRRGIPSEPLERAEARPPTGPDPAPRRTTSLHRADSNLAPIEVGEQEASRPTLVAAKPVRDVRRARPASRRGGRPRRRRA